MGLRYTFGSLFYPFVGFPYTDHAMRKFPLSARSAGVLVLVVAALAATYFWWRQLPGRMEEGCNLHERRCSAPVPDGGRVLFGVEPRPIGYGGPLKLSVTLEEAAAEKVEVDFAGLDAPTSFNRVALEATKPGRFEGEATLPMCVFEPIEWQASVLLGTGDKRKIVPFAFNIDPAVKPKSAPRLTLATPPSGGTAFLRGADGVSTTKYQGGYATVLFFGYTSAPQTCPQPLVVIDGALNKLSPEERAKVRVVMVALDPTADAPERLQPELQARHLPNYVVVTGAGADLVGIARLHGAALAPQPVGPDGKPRIAHSMIYSLLDPSGRLVGQIAAQDPERLAGELRKVLGASATKPISSRQ